MRQSRVDPPAGTVVFDIGGTWFRSAMLSDRGVLLGRTRQPAISAARDPECDVAALHARLLEYLVAEARRLRAEHGAAVTAVISLGAALNATTGLVLDSGPLWGPHGRPIDLVAELRKREPGIAWRVVNDVTAALLRHVHALGARSHGRMALITLSSGIACRVYDFARRCVPVDPRHGLQGEIGHLPVAVTVEGRALELACACGGMNHLNAFTSGLGIEAVLRHLATVPGARRGARGAPPPVDDGGASVAEFLAAARAGDPWSRSLLAEVCKPLAGILSVMLTHDPELDPIVFVGGVTAALGDVLVDTLCEHLEAAGLYQVTERDPGYFRARLRLGFLDDDSGLLGCGLVSRYLDAATAGAT